MHEKVPRPDMAFHDKRSHDYTTGQRDDTRQDREMQLQLVPLIGQLEWRTWVGISSGSPNPFWVRGCLGFLHEIAPVKIDLDDLGDLKVFIDMIRH